MITYPNAIDENGIVHKIGAITKDNRGEHRYYCLGCGKEMVPVLCGEDRTSHFRHKVNDLCNSETYLHNLAKKYLANQFETQPKFEISYFATNECPKKDSCKIYNTFHSKECYGKRCYTFDLKKIYDTCQIEGVYNGYRADVLLTNSKLPQRPPVFLEVSVSHDCAPEKIDSGIRIIEIKVRNEEDLNRPLIENDENHVPAEVDPWRQFHFTPIVTQRKVTSSSIRFYNFVSSFHQDNVYQLDRFVVMFDGEMGKMAEPVICGEMEMKHIDNAVLEVNLLLQDQDSRIKPSYNLNHLGMSHALLRGLPANHCTFCANYFRCVIPVNVERYNPILRKKVMERLSMSNRAVKEGQVDKYRLASSCHNWNLNKRLCEQIINSFRGKYVLVWQPDIDK